MIALKFRAMFRKVSTRKTIWQFASLHKDGIVNPYTDMQPGYSQVSDWEQYTGLRDESGTETYEGDLVRIKDRTDVYKFVFDCFYSAFLFVGVHGGERITTNRLDGNWVRVIGNIHENPDLLKGEV